MMHIKCKLEEKVLHKRKDFLHRPSFIGRGGKSFLFAGSFFQKIICFSPLFALHGAKESVILNRIVNGGMKCHRQLS